MVDPRQVPRHRPTATGSRALSGRLAAGTFTTVIGLGLVACDPVIVLEVGPGHPFATPCQAIAAAPDGAVIEIDAAGNGSYDGDVCTWSKDGLTLRGVNGRAHIDAAGANSGGKGIWVIAGDDTVVENIELSGATVPDENGAGIRQEGAGLTVIGSSFHHNENGILTGANAASDILIDSSEFAHNGFGDGFSHNMYIGAVRSFTLRFSSTHHAQVGHLVKSRAANNFILYNRILGETGSSSYEIDLPNAGLSFVIGNLVQQGATTQNSAMFSYGAEGATHPSAQLYVVNNTFVNDRGSGTAVSIGAGVSTPARVQNNISTGSSTFVNQAGAVLTTNCVVANPAFVNRPAFDYHLQPGSPCVDVGSAPGIGNGFDLEPGEQYVHPTNHTARTTHGAAIDAGAYER